MSIRLKDTIYDLINNSDKLDGKDSDYFHRNHRTDISNLNSAISSNTVTFDYSSPTGGPGGWVNGFASIHNNYLSSFIANTHRTNDWYVGWVDTSQQNPSTAWKKLAFTTDIPTTLKCPSALTIQLNGTSQGAWDGSSAKTINITPASIGAATSSHTHDYASSSHNHNSLYVSSLGTSGNYVTWTKNGTTNNITVPYSTNSDTVDGYHAKYLFPAYNFPNKHNVYVCLGTLTIPQNGYGMRIRVFTGFGYNASNEQKRMTNIYIRTSNGTASGGLYYAAYVEAFRYGSYDYYIVQNSSTSFTLWCDKVNYAGEGFIIPEYKSDCSFEYSGTTATTLPSGATKISKYQIAYSDSTVAAASKLATARTISLTGSVTGSGSFDGSGNLSIATTTNHTHNYAATNHTHSNLIIQGNGTTLGTYTGGSAVTVNLTYSNVGAASSGHTHDYAASSHNHNGVYAVQCGTVPQSGRIGYSGFYETSGATSSTKNHPFSSGWMHFINCQHSNTSNNYALQIAASFYDNTNFKIRVTNGSDSTTWNTILHSGNWSSYCAAASHTHNYLSSLPSHTHNYAGSSSAGGDATRSTDSYALITKESGTVANTWGNHGIRTFIGGWATTSAGFSTQYGTTLNIAGYSTWYYRLALTTSGRIEYWRGINTTTLGRIGYLAYTSDIPTSLPANGGNADTTDSHHFSTVSSLPASPNSNTVYFIV